MFAFGKGLVREQKCDYRGGTRTPLRSPCIIPSPCIYTNPRATSASCQGCQLHVWSVEGQNPTSLDRFASLRAFTKWLMSPFSIHSDTIANRLPSIATPKSGRTFGCRRALHTNASLQNLYESWSSHQCRLHTLSLATHTPDLIKVA